MRVPKSKLVYLLAAGLLLAASLGAQSQYTARVSTGNPFDAPESAHDCNVAENLLANCSFESGDFTSWATQDLTGPFWALQVGPGGVTPGFGFFSSAPTEGTFAALHGFDGGTPGIIEIAQDVSIPAASGVELEFDYRGAWDTTFGATQARTFEVQVQPLGGGAALQTDTILTAPPNDTTTDTGPLSAIVDLSAFGGQDVRVAFVWNVPEVSTGPGFFQLDNVLLLAESSILAIPTVSQLGLVLLVVLLGGLSLFLIRRRDRQTSS